ncbi:ERF family protein [Limosilactobacillus pontis]|uniref:ERF family protein n=1 Tax=Limosilactobacillus pontis TaxID=35787 RepID=UPI002F26D330
MTLLTVQMELKAPKSQYNKFGGYNYRSTEDILQAVKPLLKKDNDNLSLSDEPIMVGDWHYIKATATFTDKNDKTTVSTGYAREAANKKGMDDSQITGTASSYARKYALNGLFLIDDTKDADTDEYHNQQQPSSQNQPAQKLPAPQKQMSQLQKNQQEYKKLRQQIIDSFSGDMTLDSANKQIQQTAGINNGDSTEAKYQKMVKAAKEILSKYNNGGKKND